MTIKHCYGEIIAGKLVLPAEALEVLPEQVKLYMVVDSEWGTVTTHATDPSQPKHPELFDALADLNAELTLDEYTAPVPEHLLKRKRKSEGGDE